MRGDLRLGQIQLELCEEINQLNEYMPLYAFANTYSTLDVSLNDLRMQVRFFEYALGAATDIAAKIKQNTDEYIGHHPAAVDQGAVQIRAQIHLLYAGHMGGTAFQKSPVGSLFYDFFGPNTMKSDISISVSELGSLLDHSGPHKRRKSTFPACSTPNAATWSPTAPPPPTRSSACTRRRRAARC